MINNKCIFELFIDVRYRELGEDPYGKTKNASLSGAVVLVGYPVQAPGDLMGVEFTLLKPGPMRFMVTLESRYFACC